ncbi:MAG: DUF86 domain-containing protein [Synergistales bacterium]|nr:DUF86 domain-containing protein [Synergistales bacterium]
MPRDYLLYIDDILEAIQRIRSYVEGMDQSGFSADRKTQDAVVRNLEVIGEAARHVPAPSDGSGTEVEWRKIKAFRNVLAHEYFGVNVEIVWDVVQNKLDLLEEECVHLLERGAR